MDFGGRLPIELLDCRWQLLYCLFVIPSVEWDAEDEIIRLATGNLVYNEKKT